MRRLLEAYQYVMPAVLTPLGAFLWWRHYDGQDYDGHAALAAIAVLVPIAHAYIVPGIGTNVLRVWEFDTRLKLGRFRPHHGFVFGSATALLMLPAIGAPTAHPTLADVATSALLAALILGAVNWLYDVAAIRAGILRVYNQPWAMGRGPTAIVNDYAPWFFGGFGLIQGAGLKLAEGLLLPAADPLRAVAVGCSLLAATVTLPTLGYILQSYLRHGHHGCRPVNSLERVSAHSGATGAVGLPLPACGERVGVRGAFHALSTWRVPLTRRLKAPTSQPKSDVSDFGHPIKWPNSGKPEFGCKRGEVKTSVQSGE